MSNPYTNSGEPKLRDLKGNLWRLEEDCWIDTHVTGQPFRIMALPEPGEDADPLSVSVERTNGGRMYFKKGYICDGSSIPLLGRWLDNRVSAWPGLVHDAKHEAMRAGELGPERFVPAASLYRDMMRAFGSFWITSRLCFVGLWLLGRSSASPGRGAEYALRKARAK